MPGRAGPTSSAIRCCSGCAGSRYGWSGQPCARQAASIPACLPEQLCPSLPVGAARPGPRSRDRRQSPRPASSTLRTAANWAGSAWCDAHAIAISSVVEVARSPSTNGIACSGFTEERRRQTRARVALVARPHSRRRAPRGSPRRRAPRSTVTLIASIPRREPNVAGAAGGRSVAASTRPARRAVAGRARRAGAHRDAEDVRPAAARRSKARRCASSAGRSASSCRPATASSC